MIDPIERFKNYLSEIKSEKEYKVRKNGTINPNYFDNKLMWYFLNLSQLPAAWNYLLPEKKFPLLELPTKLIENLFNIECKDSFHSIIIQQIIICVIYEIYLGKIKHHHNLSIVELVKDGSFTELQIKKWANRNHDVALYLFVNGNSENKTEACYIIDKHLSDKYLVYKIEKDWPQFKWNRNKITN